MKYLNGEEGLLPEDAFPEEVRRALEPKMRYVLFDVRNMYDTVDEAIEAARSLPGFAEHYIGCVALESGLAPAHIGGTDGMDRPCGSDPLGGDGSGAGVEAPVAKKRDS